METKGILKMKIGSSLAFVVYCGLMVGGFVFATFVPAAPYLAFAVQVTLGFGGYLGKRLIQKKEQYSNGKTEGLD